MVELSKQLSTAVEHHQAGRLQAAEQIYRQILQTEPNHADAWHLLGVIARQAGKHELAVEYIKRAIRLNGNVAAFHANLGNAFRDLGKLDEAIACCRRALQLKPDSAATHYNLANALKDLGKLDEATACYRRALALKPGYAEAHNNLGVALHDQRKLDEAVISYRKAVELKPDYAEAHNNLGAALYDRRNPDEAEACYRRAVELKPDYAEAHNNLGSALLHRWKRNEAVVCCRRAVELKPDFAEAYNNLGTAFRELGMLEEAVACYRRALELKPDLVAVHNNLGDAFRDLGTLDEAVASYRRALELEPDYAEARCNLGISLNYQGKMEEGMACCRQVVQLELGDDSSEAEERRESTAGFGPAARQPQPFPLRQAATSKRRPRHSEASNSLAEAFLQLATILGSRLPEDDLRAMRQWLGEPSLGDDACAVLHFGLAHVLDARGDYGAAAEHLAQANAARLAGLKTRKRGYDPAMHSSFNSSMMATFTPQFFARTSGFGVESELPVFVVGLPRSGTTLVEQVLASHSRVFGGGELRYCDDTFRSLPSARAPVFNRSTSGPCDRSERAAAMHRNETPFQCLLDLDQETARFLALQYLDRLRALDEQAIRIVDKMPGNFEYLGLITVLFPRARLIHCRRDLRDVALSCWATKFTSLSWTCDQDHILSYFEQYSGVMDHWRRVLPSPPLDVDYEEIVADTEGVARRIVSWCELEWEPGCRRFYETQRPVKTASAAQVRRPIYKSSVGRWKNYEKPLGELFSRVHRLDQIGLERRPMTDRSN